MSVAQSGVFTKHLDRDVTDIFFNNYSQYETQYDKIARVRSAYPGGHYTQAELSGMGALQEKPEGNPITFDSPVEGNEVTRYYTVFALGFQITFEMINDDLFGNFKRMPAELGKSAAYKRETEFFDLFNNGFATHTAWDGNYIFMSDTRTILKDGTAGNFNEPASGTALSLTSLEVALNYGATARDSAGRPIMMKPRLLLIPPALKWTTKELLLSEFTPEGTGNSINAVQGEGLQYMVSPHLTDTAAWFVLYDNHDFQFHWKNKPSIVPNDDFHTINRLYRVFMRFATFCNNPTGVYGNPGA